MPASCANSGPRPMPATRSRRPTAASLVRSRLPWRHVRDSPKTTSSAATVLACETHASGVAAFNTGSGTPRTVGDLTVQRAQGGQKAAPLRHGACFAFAHAVPLCRYRHNRLPRKCNSPVLRRCYCPQPSRERHQCRCQRDGKEQNDWAMHNSSLSSARRSRCSSYGRGATQ